MLIELLPHHAKIVGEICLIKTMNTEAINHDPAITFIQTGSPQPGRAGLGPWVSCGVSAVLGQQQFRRFGRERARRFWRRQTLMHRLASTTGGGPVYESSSGKQGDQRTSAPSAPSTGTGAVGHTAASRVQAGQFNDAVQSIGA